MSQLQTLSRRCRKSLFLFTVLLVILVPFIWLSSKSTIATTWSLFVGVDNVPIVVTPTTRLLGILITLIPASAICYITWLITTLLKNYERFILFTKQNTKIVRKLGFSLYLWMISNIIFKTIISLLLTIHNSPHQKLLFISISGMDIQSFIIASIIVLLSWVFVEAEAVAEDNALIP